MVWRDVSEEHVIFSFEERGDVFFRNVGLSANYAVLQPRIPGSSIVA
jgi:hypothetical protein